MIARQFFNNFINSRWRRQLKCSVYISVGALEPLPELATVWRAKSNRAGSRKGVGTVRPRADLVALACGK